MKYADIGAGGVPGAGSSVPVTSTRQATAISGLTPGVTYMFQVRALGKLGYSDWSDPVKRMCI